MANKGLTAIPTLYQRLVGIFPQKFEFCFAYGSGAIKQAGSNDLNTNMIDIIFTVETPDEWHSENIQINPKHYSWLRWLGHNAVANYQEHWGAKVYFNTLVPIEKENAIIKYGIISHTALVTDLLDWSELYLAGRLHKPVEIIKQTTDSELRSALQQNLHSAVHAALLMLPETFTEEEFYKTITALSYSGDFRMIFGEDKNKIQNIVTPQIRAFHDLYAPVITSLSDYIDIIHSDDGKQDCCQDPSPTARHHHLNQLPKAPQRAMVRFWNKGSSKLRQDTEDTLRAMAYDPDLLPPHLKKKVLQFSNTEAEAGSTIEETVNVKQMMNTSIGPLIPPGFNSRPHQDINKDTSGDADIIIGPVLPQHLNSTGASDDDMYGPALPPRLGELGGKAILGPTLPPGFKPSTTVTDSEDSDAEVVGPLPPSEAGLADGSYIQQELERRAQKMKRKLAGEDDNDGALKRESWMLELPPDRATEFGLGPRQFRKKEKLDPGDKSVWTDTPADRLNKKHSQKEHKNAESEMHQLTMMVRDEEMEQLSRKHPSNKNRQESLLETHQRELNKKKKQNEAGKPKERRPFDRDVDLQANRFDEAQKEAIFKKAQLLNDRFSRGETKFL
uniref:Phosphatidate cytidylyltransferase, mitochondrial n=1 Tax=Timema monikensis TaxID=170555 RepID=A0A7R9DYJ6_9NEOP|nr:unnamed protein product [Timema monikensis]